MSVPPGLLLVDKPVGPTSHDVVARVRRASGVRKVGHAGTLDPFASGLLLVLLGSATRLSEYLLNVDKSYRATARLGVETTTHDLQGEVVEENPAWAGLTEGAVAATLESFRGTLHQLPPRYSSKKVGGEPAHRRVRRGEDVVLEPVEVRVHEISLLDFEPPLVRFHVRCSSGTYVRALARDLGRGLGVGAHLTELVRDAVGEFSLESAVPLDDLADRDSVERNLVSPALALSHLPAVSVPPGDAVRIRQGQLLPMTDPGVREGASVRILLDGNLVAVGEVSGDLLRPRKVLSHG